MISRYTLEKMANIWSEENKLTQMLRIEVLVCEAWSRLGKIPPKSLEKIKKKIRFNIRKIRELEKKTQHDVVAFVDNLSQSLGKEARYLHLGLTSSDLLDTALGLQLRDSCRILIQDLKELLKVLSFQAKTHKYTLCIGRTHGVHAEVITLGLKFCLWYEEMNRALRRLQILKEEVAVGKISGAVGNYAHLPPFIERYVCKKLSLKPMKISSQIIPRDIHAQYLLTLALIGSSLEKFATEIRHLQRTEVQELQEPFLKTQKGSSAMPHKRNPVICERICGLARILRANAQVALENINLWHERDISHSSAERIILPDSSILLDYLLSQFLKVLKELVVYPQNMLVNILKTKGLIFSQRVLLKLMEKGMTRTEAYEIVKNLAMKSCEENKDFKSLLQDDHSLKKYLSKEDIEDCFSVDYYLRNVDKIFKHVGID